MPNNVAKRRCGMLPHPIVSHRCIKHDTWRDASRLTGNSTADACEPQRRHATRYHVGVCSRV
jgi:hypothetical protein